MPQRFKGLKIIVIAWGTPVWAFGGKIFYQVLKVCEFMMANFVLRHYEKPRRTRYRIYMLSNYVILLWRRCITSLPKVIWEEGRVAALSDTYAIKFPLVTMARPKFAPKSTPSRGPIPKLHYLSHPWTRPTYDARRLPDPIRRFSTMHWADRRTDRQIVHGKVWRL